MVKNLKQWHAEHASALVAEAATKAELDAAKAEYDKLLQQLEKQHPDVVQRLNVARESHTAAADKTKSVDGEVRKLLGGLNKWETLPEGYEQIRRKKVVYSEEILFRAALQYAPYLLLKIDEEKVEKFAFAMCEEITKSSTGEKLAEPYFVLPDHYRTWLPSLHVNFEYAPRISTTKVQKHVPAPDELPLDIDPMIAEDTKTAYLHELLADKPANMSLAAYVSKNPELNDLYNSNRDIRKLLTRMETETDKHVFTDAVGPTLQADTEQQVGKATVTNSQPDNPVLLTFEVNAESEAGYTFGFEVADVDEPGYVFDAFGITDDGEPIEELFDSFFGTGNDDEDPDPEAEPVF